MVKPNVAVLHARASIPQVPFSVSARTDPGRGTRALDYGDAQEETVVPSE